MLITGCNAGLGRALLERAKQNSIETFPHFRKHNPSFPDALVGDIADDNFSEKLYEYMRDNDIDVFVNNAASYNNADIFELTEKEIRDFVNVNVIGQILCVRAALRHFKERGRGKVLNINSIAGIMASDKEPIYCASKFAMRGFSKSMQLVFVNQEIKIIDVHLGAMKTRMTQDRNNYELLMEPDDVAAQLISILNNSSSAIINEITIRRN